MQRHGLLSLERAHDDQHDETVETRKKVNSEDQVSQEVRRETAGGENGNHKHRDREERQETETDPERREWKTEKERWRRRGQNGYKIGIILLDQ